MNYTIDCKVESMSEFHEQVIRYAKIGDSGFQMIP